MWFLTLQAEFRYVCSAGVGRSRLISKIVCGLAKPDGLSVALPEAESGGADGSQDTSQASLSQELGQPQRQRGGRWPAEARVVSAESYLRASPVTNVPCLGYKSKHESALATASIGTVGEVRLSRSAPLMHSCPASCLCIAVTALLKLTLGNEQFAALDLAAAQKILGSDAGRAAELLALASGDDPSLVVDLGPPKSLSEQMVSTNSHGSLLCAPAVVPAVHAAFTQALNTNAALAGKAAGAWASEEAHDLRMLTLAGGDDGRGGDGYEASEEGIRKLSLLLIP